MKTLLVRVLILTAVLLPTYAIRAQQSPPPPSERPPCDCEEACEKSALKDACKLERCLSRDKRMAALKHKAHKKPRTHKKTTQK
jgi:hypothetical protein